VPDVLASLVASGAPDGFAELLATLGVTDPEAAGSPDETGVPADGDAEGDAGTAPAALAAATLACLPQVAEAPIVVLPTGTSAAGATDAVAAQAPPDEAPARDASAAADGVEPLSRAESGATPSQPIMLPQDAEVGSAEVANPDPATPAPAPDRSAAAHPDAATATTDALAPAEHAVAPVGVVAETAAEPRPSAGDATATPLGPHRIAGSTRGAAAEAPATPEPSGSETYEAVAKAVSEPGEPLQRREPTPSRIHALSESQHTVGAESASGAPRPTMDATATPSAETAPARRYADTAALLDTSRPLGRLADGGEMRLEIAPEGLGPIEIHVAVRADGVQASLWTQQDHARAALEANRPLLAHALERSSLRLEEFTVGVGQHHHAAHDDDRTPRRWANPLASEPASASTPILAPVRTRGLSLRA
jgi:flagellar hook-length control protein FliK